MARQPNQFYQDPTADIGSSLATALFGNPAAAAKQRDMQAQADARDATADEARAHAQVYRGQSTGLDTTNTANAGLPELFANLYKTTAPIAARAPVGLESDDAGEIPAVAGVNADQAMKAGMPALLAAMVQGGHAANVGGVTQALAAFGGGDEMARRGLVSAGHSPTKDFALTPERADQIAGAEQASKLAQALGVANINHATDIPVAKIRAGADLGVASINNRDKIAVANIAAGSRTDSAKIRGGSVALYGNNPGGINDGDFAKSQPGYVGANGRYAQFASMQQGEAAQKALITSYIARGYDTPAKIAQRYAPAADGNDPAAYAATIARTLGISVDTKLSPADVDRFQAAQGRAENGAYRPTTKAAAAPKPPKLISPAVRNMLDVELDRQIGSELRMKLSSPALADLRARAATFYQTGGNPSDAVRQAVVARTAAGHEINARRNASAVPTNPAAKPKGNPAYPDARRAPDGNLYVVIGKKPDGSPRYGSVPG